jgi:Ca-activated chloride channel homolog
MIFGSPQLLWLVPVLLFVTLVVSWRRSVAPAVMFLRMLLFAALVVALADPIRPGTSAPPPLLIMVDGSASIPAEQREAAWQTAQTIAEAHGRNETTVALFGRDVAVAADSTMPTVDPTASDLPGALELARGLLADRGATDTTATERRVLLLTDGASTTGGADAAAAQLRNAGIAVDVLALAAGNQPDARVAEVAIPAGLREGQSYRGEIVIMATQPTMAILRFSEDDQIVTQETVTLEAGRNSVPFSGTAGRSGVHRYAAELDTEDAHAPNNRLERAVVVGAPPRVLVIENAPDSAAQLRDLLENGGVQSEARRADDLPSQLADLDRFDAVVLQDISADAMTEDQQLMLREYVRSLGKGLLVMGGANSFGLGNYKDTPLEDVLPVDMQPPPRREREAVALLLIIDRSASMYGRDPRTSKLELAKGGAIAAIQTLVPGDRLGVLVFDNTTEWIVPFTTVGDGRSMGDIQDDLASITFGGGTDIYQALAEGLPELNAQSDEGNVGAKHAVLLTDGRSYGAVPDYDRLVDAARAGGVTLSTIAIGEDADRTLLEHIADRGEGRYYFASDPQELPRLTLQETEILREDPRVEGELQPQPALQNGLAHPTIRGFVPRRMPIIDGYVATTLKPTADMVLQTPDGDAILAGWQYGLGRALAWTSDSGENWADTWQGWDESGTFWSQLLSYTFPDPTMGPLQTRVERRGDGAYVVAEARDTDGSPLDLANIGVLVRDPVGAEQTIRLKQTAPGFYEAPMPATGGTLAPGAYRLSSALEKNGTRLEALAGWSQPYPEEYMDVVADPGLAERIAQAGGGTVLLSANDALTALTAPPMREPLSLWPYLAAFAALLWPFEVLVRRRWAFGGA